MHIYPAIDLREGKCVRLLQGRADQQTTYSDNPVEVAREFIAAGATWIHVVDLDGAFEGSPKNLSIVENLAALNVKIQMGGGVREAATLRRVLEAGVSRAVLGTKACESEQFLTEMVDLFGERVAVGIDAKDGKVAVRGWVDTTAISAFDFAARASQLGVGTIIYTDISTDGMLTGPNLDAQQAMCAAVTPATKVIASGGVSQASDISALVKLSRTSPNLDGVIIGKAIYEKRISVTEAIALTA